MLHFAFPGEDRVEPSCHCVGGQVVAKLFQYIVFRFGCVLWFGFWGAGLHRQGHFAAQKLAFYLLQIQLQGQQKPGCGASAVLQNCQQQVFRLHLASVLLTDRAFRQGENAVRFRGELKCLCSASGFGGIPVVGSKVALHQRYIYPKPLQRLRSPSAVLQDAQQDMLAADEPVAQLGCGVIDGLEHGLGPLRIISRIKIHGSFPPDAGFGWRLAAAPPPDNPLCLRRLSAGCAVRSGANWP